jgi:hypothetical protein
MGQGIWREGGSRGCRCSCRRCTKHPGMNGQYELDKLCFNIEVRLTKPTTARRAVPAFCKARSTTPIVKGWTRVQQVPKNTSEEQ